MLQGDAPIDNDDPYNTDQSTGSWIKEGPHIMIVGPKGSVDNIPVASRVEIHTLCSEALTTST